MASTDTRGSRRHRLVLVAAAVLSTALALAPGAAAATTVSSNWGGNVALPASGSQGFSSVSGSWRVPSVSCTPGRDSYSAAWVGLGGYRNSSNALEQVGTDADCSRSGHVHYASWFELIPAAPVSVALRARAGDQMTGSVTVRGHDVTLRLRDLSSGARYSTTRRVAALDASSAEWIVEAPSSCDAEGCQTLALTDFGTVSFLTATATAASHTGPVEDPAWSYRAIELRQGSRPAGARSANGHALGASLITASPSSPEGALGAFSVIWGEQRLHGEAPPEEAPLGEGS